MASAERQRDYSWSSAFINEIYTIHSVYYFSGTGEQILIIIMKICTASSSQAVDILVPPSAPSNPEIGHVSTGEQWCTVSCEVLWQSNRCDVTLLEWGPPIPPMLSNTTFDECIHWLKVNWCVSLICMDDLFGYVVDVIIPPQAKLLGVYWFHSVRPSVRPSVPHPVSALQRLQFWLDLFDIYTAYQATLEGVSRVKFLAKFQYFWQFFEICNFDFCLVFTWDLMWITSMGNHGAAGVSQNAGILVILVTFYLTPYSL